MPCCNYDFSNSPYLFSILFTGFGIFFFPIVFIFQLEAFFTVSLTKNSSSCKLQNACCVMGPINRKYFFLFALLKNINNFGYV